MRHHAGEQALANLLVIVLIGIGTVMLIEQFGFDTGWRSWLPCATVAVAVGGGGSEMPTLVMLVGLGLCFLPSLRSTGVGILVLGFAGAYALELIRGWLQVVCSGGQLVP